MKSRSQLIIAGSIILILFAGLFFYFLTRSTNRFNDFGSTNFPANEAFQVINEDGNNELRDRSGRDLTPKRETGSIRRVSTDTVAGYRILAGESKIVRYIESQTGHIYDFNISNGGRDRITNTSFQRIINANWINDRTVFITYDQDGEVQNWIGQITFDNRLEGQIFPFSLESIVGDQNDHNLAYYLHKNIAGGSTLYSYNISSNHREFVMSFDFNQADLILNDRGQLYLITRPSKDHDQVVLEIFPRNRTFSLLGTDSRTGYVPGNELDLWLDLNKLSVMASDGDIETMPGYTLAEKCDYTEHQFICAVSDTIANKQAWSWPENWYRGELKLDEELLSIDEFGNLTKIADLGSVYDVNDLQATGSHVYLISRSDGYLYEVLR